MIIFSCQSCGKELHVKDEFAGQKGACKFCGAMVQVPAPAGVGVPSGAGAQTETSGPDEDMGGFDDIARSIAESYEPVEDESEEEEDKGKKKKKKVADKKELNRLYVIFPILIALAGASWYFFMVDPPAEPVPEHLLMPKQSLDETMSYMRDQELFPNVAWVSVREDKNEVVIGWRQVANIPGGEVPPSRVAANAATMGSEAKRGEVKVYLVDTSVANEDWQPGQPGVLDKARAINGDRDMSF